MKFCEKCENMYYIKINEETKNLSFYCRNCGNESNAITKEELVFKTQYKDEDKDIKNILNEYSYLDPTLPRMNKIKCVNPECLTNTDAEEEKNREIIYVKYDEVNLNYLYMCSTCKVVWKS